MEKVSEIKGNLNTANEYMEKAGKTLVELYESGEVRIPVKVLEELNQIVDSIQKHFNVFDEGRKEFWAIALKPKEDR